MKEFIIDLLKSKWTKWIPLGSYQYSKDYVVLVKRNKKTGMLKFKTLRVNGQSQFDTLVNPILPSGLIDTQKAWDKITNKSELNE